MQSNWKLSQDGKSASRTLGDGEFQSRSIDVLVASELASALPADPTHPNVAILEQIATLETEQSKPRRVREAILSIDNGWMLETNAQIATLRASLT